MNVNDLVVVQELGRRSTGSIASPSYGFAPTSNPKLLLVTDPPTSEDPTHFRGLNVHLNQHEIYSVDLVVATFPSGTGILDGPAS